MKDINIMVFRHSAFYSPLIAAIAGGFLKKEGLVGTYSLLPAGASIIDEVASGRVDVAQAAVSLSWNDLEKGQKPAIAQFSQINTCDGFFIAAREPDSDFSWSKLKSGNFMHVHGGQPEVMLRYGAHRMGLELDNVQRIEIPSTDEMMNAWRRGKGDYFHEQGAYPQQLEHESCAHVVASVGDAVGPVAFSSLICRWDWLDTDVARRFVGAYRDSREWTNTAEPDQIAVTEAEYFADHSPQAVSRAIDAYQKMGAWEGDIQIPADLYQNALNVFEHAGLITRRHPYDSVVVPPPE
ncbi:MAG: ABC transporter substrate-binding protein [bacterium]|nr:ABC transporter substrate-binding protein [bacterium]